VRGPEGWEAWRLGEWEAGKLGSEGIEIKVPGARAIEANLIAHSNSGWCHGFKPNPDKPELKICGCRFALSFLLKAIESIKYSTGLWHKSCKNMM
jgi:hypothetical protein